MWLHISVFVLALIVQCTNFANSAIINFESAGATPRLQTIDIAFKNRDLLNSLFSSMQSGDTLFFPNKTFFLVGGVVGNKLSNITIQIDGTLLFSDDRDTWPVDSTGAVVECIVFTDIEYITFTSSGQGTIDGNGKKWWGAIDFLKHQENRPRLFHIITSKDIIVEYLLFKNSPYWTFYAEKSNGLIVRYSSVDVRWDEKDKHTLLDLQAFNTDGFDVTGKYVHMHDLNIWNDDDCIAVKDGSEHMLFERINASGLGLVIGSIGKSLVNNITFKDSVMYSTFKGIYLKTRWYDDAPLGEAASISNILYQNITMYSPQQWAIWIGPAQQTGQHCPLYWPGTPHSECLMSGTQTWTNITLRDITIYDPVRSPGVLIGNSTNPMKNVVFENVVVKNAGSYPWGDQFYDCSNIEGFAIGTTDPVPPCFTSLK